MSPLPFPAGDFALGMMRAYAFGQRPDQRGNDLEVGDGAVVRVELEEDHLVVRYRNPE